jgi:septum site-determining protein MinC
MAIVQEDASSNCYDIKSADLSLVALILKSTDISLLVAALKRQMDASPGFFEQDPLLIDVSQLESEFKAADLQTLMGVLREHALVPLAIKGAKDAFLEHAKGLGLVDTSDARIRRSVQLAEVSASMDHVRPAASSVAVEAMVVDKPLRSGQQVYAKGRDLIVLAMVNAGAEVIADGHIHVYGSLRGKAIAGARGNTQAKIFALVMEPELISIAGVYRTSENPLSNEVLGKTAQVSLQSDPEGDKLLIKPLNL